MEFSALNSGFDFVISASPLILQCYYGEKFGFVAWKDILNIVDKFEVEYPSLNIYLQRDDVKWHNNARFQTQEDAVAMDDEIREFLLNNLNTLFFEFNHVTEFENLYSFIVNQLN